MNIDRIALYLAGKFPPYYRKPFDKLEFIELIRSESQNGFTEDFFKIIDSQDFYLNCLNRVQKANQDALRRIVEILEIPEDAGGLRIENKTQKNLQLLKTEYEDMKKGVKTNNQTRGRKFERWLNNFFDTFDLQSRASYQAKIDQIDGSFELDGKEYLIEAKWLEKPLDKNPIDNFSQKANRCLIGTVGLIISVSGFNKNAKTIAASNRNILLMSDQDIQKVLSGEILLPQLIRKLRRRMAEEGKPYLD